MTSDTLTKPAAGPPEGTEPSRRRRRVRWLDWMAIPTMVILAVVIGYPIVRAVLLAFTDYNLIGGAAASEFVGVQNFQVMSNDPVFWESLRNTFVFTSVSLAGAGLAGLTLAFATENLHGPWRFLRGLLLTPWAIPIIVVAFLFRFLFLDRGGLINELLLSAGLVDSAIPWLTSSQWALVSVTVANIWQTAPFFLLVFTAGLGAVPDEVIEAAKLDKASPWSMIWQIKMPFLRGPAVVAALITTIENLNSFPLIWAMTEGGPGYSSSTLAIYAYRLVFANYDLGYASAIGVVWLVSLMGVAWFFVRALQGDKS